LLSQAIIVFVETIYKGFLKIILHENYKKTRADSVKYYNNFVEFIKQINGSSIICYRYP